MTVRKTKNILMLIALVGTAAGSFAQNSKSIWQTMNYSAYVGGTCPIGTYGKSNISTDQGDIYFINNNWVLADQGGMKADAKLGFNLGLKATLPFEEVGIKLGNNDAMPLAKLGDVGKVLSLVKFSFVGTIDFFYNGIRSKAEENIFPAMISHHVHFLRNVNMSEDKNDITLEFEPSYQLYYINIPLMVGVNGVYDFNNVWSFWAETEIGVDLRKISSIKDFKYEARLNNLMPSGDNHVQTFSTTKGSLYFDWSAAFACQVGVGATWQKRYSVGLHYYFLGKAKIYGKKDYTFYDPYEYGNYGNSLDYKTTVKTFTGFSIDKKLSQNMLVLRVGYNF
ncbi:MAG: hypothetical protein J5605_00150 [Bacteroidales bacterium]|nr:hypothetical protein [Bacteroidales bacterium]